MGVSVSPLRFEALFNNTSIGIIIVDGNGTIIMMNDFALAEFGYKGQEICGKNVERLIPPSYRQQHHHYFKKFFENPFAGNMGKRKEVVALKKNGTEFPAEINLSYYQLHGDDYVIAMICDITEKKAQEDTILQLNKELEQKVEKRTAAFERNNELLRSQMQETVQAEKKMLFFQQLFQQVVDNYAGGSITVSDREYNYIFCGGTSYRDLGIHPAALLRKRLFPLLSSEQFKLISPVLEKVFSGQSIIEQDVPGVWKGRHYSFDAFPLVDQDGNISNIALITHDVSEMKKIEEDLLQSLQKEKDLSELKSRFVSTASHEFRTPLSTILSSAFLLKNYTQTEDQVKREKHIHRIESSVNLLNDILNDFLSVEKMEEGKVGVKYCRFNIRELLNAVCNEMNPVLKPGQHFNYYHSGKFMVSLDPSLIKNSLINLLSNAIKFSGGDQPIEIHSRVDENNIMLSVKDHGIGISEQDQAHLFERFFRAANAAAIKGTGLGLHLVNKYVSLMEGRLEFKSELNAGSEFIIKLPVKKNDP